MKKIIPAAVIERLTKFAFAYIERHYGALADPRQRLDYHGVHHTQQVIERVTIILRTIQAANPSLVTERDFQRGVIAAAFHDIIQQWEEAAGEIDGVPIIMMKRHTGFNEEESARLAREQIEEINQQEGKKIFTESDMEVVTEAIRGTIPDFDIRLRTVVQPNVTQESNIVTKALALADLGGSGMGSPRDYKTEGDALFREMNLDIRWAAVEGLPLKNDQKELARKRALEWTASQAEFAYGRAVRLQQELLWIQEPAREAVGALFGSFNDSIIAAQTLFDQRAAMDTGALLHDMGI